MKLLILLLVSSSAVIELTEGQLLGIDRIQLLNKLKQFNRTRLEEVVRTSNGANSRALVAITNEYFDLLFRELSKFLVDEHYDPMKLPDVETSFEWTIFYGHASLSKGQATGLHSIHRTQDGGMVYGYPYFGLSFNVDIKELKFNYDYEAKFMGMGPSGTADGYVRGTQIYILMVINLSNLRAKLDGFRITTLGDIGITFSGSAITDWLINLLSPAVISAFSPKLAATLDDLVKTTVNQLLDVYHGTLCQVLDDCSEPPEALQNRIEMSFEEKVEYYKNVHYNLGN